MTSVEVCPANDWCERWEQGQPRWTRASQGGFNPADYSVKAIDEEQAKAYVVSHHYAGSYVAAVHRYGLFEAGDILAGVLVLSNPQQAAVLTNPFPDLEPYGESLELGRLVLADRIPGNAESWMLGQVFDLAAAEGVRGVVSFSDPVARTTADGTVLFPGHVGTIYQAANFRFCGRATPRYLRLLPDGKVLGDRARSKVRRRERGHAYVERLLVSYGARPLRDGDDPAAWLEQAQAAAGVRRVRHDGNFRYCTVLGSRRERQLLRRRLPPAEPYPKHLAPDPTLF